MYKKFLAICLVVFYLLGCANTSPSQPQDPNRQLSCTRYDTMLDKMEGKFHCTPRDDDFWRKAE